MCLFLLCPVFVFSAESRALVKFLDESGVELSWEPYLETGRLSFGYQTVSFRVGEPWILLDSEGKIPCEALRKTGGTLLIPETTEKVLREIFFPPRPEGPRIGAIFIDPGHGGKDPGTIGRHTSGEKTLTVSEKDIVLDTALILGGMLKKRFADKQIVFSRTTDVYLTLEERPERAHAVKLQEGEAIIFVSIHANASLNPKARGYEVWYLPSSYRRDLLTEKDVEADNREILPIMNVMLEEEFTQESILLAQNILKGFDACVGSLSENRGLKDESWFVVRKARMPSVLVEIGFVTNPDEAKLLCDRNHLQKIAQAIYTGIDNFVRQFEGKGVFVP
ncbi:MAG: N-acetylmuramoyl-L-alanine amidase [Spirochaetales bacterium]|nr:N-acetylmuramoyl-L-alanine amidase [Spirochaetales bacterium]